MEPQKTSAETEAVTATFLELRLKLRRIAGAILRSDDDVDDALQETFLRTFRCGAREREHGAFLTTALRNVCIDMLRRRRPHADLSTEADHCIEPPDNIDARDTIKRVKRIMTAKLSGRELEVFELHTFEQLDYDEIAVRLGMSAQAVRTAMSRARKTIKEYCKNC